MARSTTSNAETTGTRGRRRWITLKRSPNRKKPLGAHQAEPVPRPPPRWVRLAVFVSGVRGRSGKFALSDSRVRGRSGKFTLSDSALYFSNGLGDSGGDRDVVDKVYEHFNEAIFEILFFIPPSAIQNQRSVLFSGRSEPADPFRRL